MKKISVGTVEVKLKFNLRELECLYHTSCKSFLIEPSNRWHPINKTIAEILEIEKASKYPCSLKWFDSFLEAKIFACAFTHRGLPCPELMWDEATNNWAVWHK